MNAIKELLLVMKNLRDPVDGCPWDRAQSIHSIAPYTLEEAYEVVESIEDNDLEGLCDELGDLLFHIVFYAQMAEEQGEFGFEDICEGVTNKLRRRHPHVFKEKLAIDENAVRANWERIKQEETREKNGRKPAEEPSHLLDAVGKSMPAMLRAEKLQKRAASVGFDWGQVNPVLDKVEEELNELKEEIDSGGEQQAIADEFGDLLFSCINLGRHLSLQAEACLRQSNQKFTDRFNYLEKKLAERQIALNEASLEQMEALWQEAKHSG